MMKTEQKIAPAALRRGMVLLCTLVLALLAVTLPAEAVVNMEPSFNVPNIRLSDSDYQNGTKPSKYKDMQSQGVRSWSAADTEITGTVTPTEWKRRAGAFMRYCCETGASSTLKITNTSGEASLLTFSYTSDKLNGGKLTFVHNDNTETGGESGGTYSAILALDETVTVTLTTTGSTNESKESNPSQYITSVTLRDIELISMNTNIAVTLATPTNGIYTAIANGEEELRVGEPHNMPRNTVYTFTASPNPGYNFVGWYVDGRKLSSEREFTASFNESCTVVARFVSEGAALFETGKENDKQYFVDLDEAVEAAKNTQSSIITLESSGTITGNYTIPAGITLLIPFDNDKTLYEATPTATTSQAGATPFRTLTMTANSSITLENGAAISVGGQYYAAPGGSKGKMVGPYGYIKMESGSAITVQKGASLYAWGFISGSGSVTVEPGGSVYEWYQILDFRGGVESTKMGNKVFPFNQYAVQNIEVPLTVYAGASETVYTALYALRSVNPTSISFIGDKGLFKLTSGSLTKAYDGSTDRMIYTINGVAELSTLSLKLATIKVNSSSYVLPLTNNMTVDLKSGSKLTVNQTVALLPGVEVSIAKGAELTVSSEKSMFIYDVDEWGKYFGGGDSNSRFIPVVYAPGKTGTRAPLADAKIDVNGLLRVTKIKAFDWGSFTDYNHDIYTTEHGANICSSEGTGKYIQLGNCEKSEEFTYQYDGSTTKHDIRITPAQLLNKDGSYTPTAGSKAGDTFTYCTGSECGGGKWVKNLQVAAIIDSTGTQTPYPTLQEAVEAYTPDDNTAPKNYIKLLHSTTEDINTTNDLYLDLNGCTVTGNFAMNSKTLYGMDSSVKGYDAPPKGKIVGSVVPYAKTTYQTPPTENKEYDRYVAISGQEADGTANLSFHRFNISVTGYRFELTSGDTPKCALFFIGKFRGDEEAKKHLKSLGFTLTDIDGETTNLSYEIPAVENIPSESDPGESPVVRSTDGAFLFEAYLIREIDKGKPDTYQKPFSATAKATFKNSGPQKDNSLSSVERTLSFEKAWTEATGLDETQQAILTKFLYDLGITK